MTRQRFNLATEPHIAEVGDYEFKFAPELSASDILEPYAELTEFYEAAEAGKIEKMPPQKLAQAIKSLRGLLASTMLPESRELFLQANLPEPVMARMFEWIMEVYGGRPTGPSNGSSASASETGAESTDTSPEQPQTPSAGGSPA